jgi:hypothetical protein
MLIRLLFYECNDSVVGIATRYGLDGPEFESRWERDFLHPSRPAVGRTPAPIQWVPVLFRGYSSQGVALTTHPLWAFVAFSRMNFIFCLLMGVRYTPVCNVLGFRVLQLLNSR